MLTPVELVAGHDGAFDGCGAPPARQQRGVDVDATKPGGIEQRLREKQAIRGDNEDIEARHARELRADACGGANSQTVGFSQRADGAGDKSAAPARWPVRLREHHAHGMLGVDQRLQDADSEAGGAGKTEDQRRTRSSRLSFASLFRIRLRFRFDR